MIYGRDFRQTDLGFRRETETELLRSDRHCCFFDNACMALYLLKRKADLIYDHNAIVKKEHGQYHGMKSHLSILEFAFLQNLEQREPRRCLKERQHDDNDDLRQQN